MSLLSTFATNSINILAGINGSEVSQALIIALSVILNDLMYLPWPIDFRIPLHLLGNKAELDFGGVWNAGMAFGSRQLVERHLFSLYFMLPLVAVCTGFMYHNWCVTSTQLHKNLSHAYFNLGILHEYFLETLCVMLQEWPLLLLGFKLISRRRSCCSLCPKSSISFCHVRSYLDLFPVHGIGYHG
jgi:Glycosyl transferase family 4